MPSQNTAPPMQQIPKDSLRDQDKRPLMAAITGGSGSGKSYLTKQLREITSGEALVIRQDRFYRDRSHLPPKIRRQRSFDVPQALDWATFITTLTRLRAGKNAKIPNYSYATHSREPTYDTVSALQVVLVEGLWLFHHQSIGSLFDIKLFVDHPVASRLQRRIARDQQERARDPKDIQRQFEEEVLPAERKWILPQAKLADRVIGSPCRTDDLDWIEHQIRPQN